MYIHEDGYCRCVGAGVAHFRRSLRQPAQLGLLRVHMPNPCSTHCWLACRCSVPDVVFQGSRHVYAGRRAYLCICIYMCIYTYIYVHMPTYLRLCVYTRLGVHEKKPGSTARSTPWICRTQVAHVSLQSPPCCAETFSYIYDICICKYIHIYMSSRYVGIVCLREHS